MGQTDNGVFVEIGANREIKAGMFAVIFNNAKAALSAYNALTGSNFPPETPVKIVTLTNVLYKGRVNDLAFLLGDKLVILIEHQSTRNENITLRLLIYIAFVYNAIYKNEHIVYGTKAIKLREPEFYVLYNGTDDTVAAKEIRRLSDLYSKEGLEQGHEFNLDLKVAIYNVNAPENADMVAKSSELNGYVYCIKRVQYYQNIGESNEDAIKHAIKDTKREGYLAEFLEGHEAEVINLLLQEFEVDTYGAVQKEEGRLEGDRDRQKSVALKMLKRHRPIEEIIEDTELPFDVVLTIQNELVGR
ncbi:hypothetical protein AGMMS49992_27730 [Clostridia bacterium]|nr:hypothetical protein AGMMS49992_27730 [Clostridia bacterium]